MPLAPALAAYRMPVMRPMPPEVRRRLTQMVVLSLALHALGIMLFGAPAGGSKEGRALWGAFNVTIANPFRGPAVELKAERGLEAMETIRERLAAPKPAPLRQPRNVAPVVPAEPVPAPEPMPMPMPLTPSPAVETPVEAIKLEPLAPIPQLLERVPPPEPKPAPFKAPVPTPAPPPAPAPAAKEVVTPPPIAAPVPAPAPPPAAAVQPLPVIPAVPLQELAPVQAPVVAPRVEVPAVPAPVAAPPVVGPPPVVTAPPVSAPPTLAPPQVASQPPAPAATPAPAQAAPAVPALRPDGDLTARPGSQAAPASREAAPSPFRQAPAAESNDYDPTRPRIDLDAARRRAGELAREGSGNRALLAFPMPVPPKPKSKMEEAIEKARKPDCRTAHKDLGLAAIVPLIANEFGEGNCRW